MRILVTGGAGYIGSVVCEELLLAGHSVVVVDNLSQGHADAVPGGACLIVGDLRDTEFVVSTLRENRIEAVVHMAARSIVSESAAQPAEYYAQNVSASLVLLDAVRTLRIRRFVFSSTAAVYGAADIALEEDTPISPANVYGETKIAVERAIAAHATAYGIAATSFRYFNAAGASAMNGERHEPETHLVPRVLECAAHGATLDVYGTDYPTPDGTAVRDYVHVNDLARAHLYALERVPATPSFRVYNLGGERGHSVWEVVRCAEKVTGRAVQVCVQARRSGDPARLVANSRKIREELGWQAERSSLATILGSAWTYRKLRAEADRTKVQETVT